MLQHGNNNLYNLTESFLFPEFNVRPSRRSCWRGIIFTQCNAPFLEYWQTFRKNNPIWKPFACCVICWIRRAGGRERNPVVLHKKVRSVGCYATLPANNRFWCQSGSDFISSSTSSSYRKDYGKNESELPPEISLLLDSKGNCYCIEIR